MAQNIFDQYGIKEVADVQFEALESDARLGVTAGDIVLYLDTLKVSTTEFTAEQTEAKGGKGAPPLIIWDFGKEINVTLQDALFSPASLAVITGAAVKEASANGKINVRVTENVTVGLNGAINLAKVPVTGTTVKYIDIKTANASARRGQIAIANLTSSGLTSGTQLKVFYDVAADGATGGTAYQITIDAAHFPGTYKVYGDTVVRNRNGMDEPFQLVFNKAKIGAETTFTMEAEGDPSVFDMNLRILRDADGNMVNFIKYNLG
jgi:hypothetical protein